MSRVAEIAEKSVGAPKTARERKADQRKRDREDPERLKQTQADNARWDREHRARKRLQKELQENLEYYADVIDEHDGDAARREAKELAYEEDVSSQ